MSAYHLDITVAELRTIVRSPEHDAHNFLWSDGATTWALDALLDELDDTEEATLGAGPESLLHLEAVDLSEQGREAFMEGYCEAAPAAYDSADDCENSPCPWCAPFIWSTDGTGNWREFHDYAARADFCPVQMGRLCALDNYDNLAEILAEEADEDSDD